ncbi:MAG: hypothetical protein QOC69_1953, partial [Mycobacterium sp.]|nr:hypothetical protein [Mycobacterium sp.]
HADGMTVLLTATARPTGPQRADATVGVGHVADCLCDSATTPAHQR